MSGQCIRAFCDGCCGTTFDLRPVPGANLTEEEWERCKTVFCELTHGECRNDFFKKYGLKNVLN